MRARLLAIAATLATAGAGVTFVFWNAPSIETDMPRAFGNLEVVDRSQCSVSNCNTQQCTSAENILADAGSTCTARFIDCPIRVGPKARALAADAGVALTAARYQQIRLIALRCPTAGGGFALGIPVTDAGWPFFDVTPRPHLCAWKPRDGGVCTTLDGGNPGFENTMQPGQFAGAGCVLKSCVEIAGETSAP